jgi:hypothetical protein
MAAFGTAHFARERRGWVQCCQRILSASGIENANSTIRPPPTRYTTLELAGGAGEIRSRLTSSAYAASFVMALSTNRKNRVLRARDLDLLNNIRSSADVALLAGRQDRLTFGSDICDLTLLLPLNQKRSTRWAVEMSRSLSCGIRSRGSMADSGAIKLCISGRLYPGCTQRFSGYSRREMVK